jgi:ferritin-like metal-binding protein YciE
MTNGEDPHALEAGLIGAAQKVEHYEIAAYGTAAAHARQLGFNSIAQLLDQTLEEERMTDEKLTKIAENQVNVQAAMEQ